MKCTHSRNSLIKSKAMKMLTARRLQQAVVLLSLMVTLYVTANSQAYNYNSTKFSTPIGLAPGSPAGSYVLSGFESVNIFNGSLNFQLPLARVGGRGSAGFTWTLPIQRKWEIDRYQLGCGGMNCWHYQYFPRSWTSSWQDSSPRLNGPGQMIGRQAGDSPTQSVCGVRWWTTLTRLTFIAADGTEYEFRDKDSDGKPLPVENRCNNPGPPRGNVWVTSDGSAMTFISDVPIYDNIIPVFDNKIRPSGYMLLPDGTRYRIENGNVKWIRDRNGNVVTIDIINQGNVSTVATDSLGRKVTISNDSRTITYDGFGGQDRVIQLNYGQLSNNLRAGYSQYKYNQLFPNLYDCYFGCYYTPGPSGNEYYDTQVISSVTIPDGRQYKLYYNPYGELAAVELPTGGRIEYDWDASPGTRAGGIVYTQDTQVPPGSFNPYKLAVHRRIVERRVYSDATTLETKTIYSGYTEDHKDAAGNLLSRVKHYFYGSPYPSLTQRGTDYSKWGDGKEVSLR